jgi:hypothetical protein
MALIPTPFPHSLGQLAVNGWPNIPQVEAELAARSEAQTLDEEKTIANKAVLDHALHAFLLGVGNKTA